MIGCRFMVTMVRHYSLCAHEEGYCSECRLRKVPYRNLDFKYNGSVPYTRILTECLYVGFTIKQLEDLP